MAKPTIKIPAREQIVYHAPVIGGARVRREKPSYFHMPFPPDDNNVLSKYRELLAVLEIDDPTMLQDRTAGEHLDLGIVLRNESRERRKKLYRTDQEVADAIASGEIDPKKISRTLEQTPTAAHLKELQDREKEIKGLAAMSAYRTGVRALFEYGEDKWYELLRPIADDAVAKGDPKRSAAVHRLARLLRDPGVAALSMAACDPSGRTDFPPLYYMFKRFDLALLWQAERAAKRQEDPIHAGRFVFIRLYGLQRAPFPSLTDAAEDCGAGLYTAQEAIENAQSIVLMQKQEIATATPAVEPKRKRMVAM